ncbi:hypothetical protein Lal_00025099 [Lupinus albus]|nr:hypothetical protein Lal_00025099 [Lupinus albus]
MHGLGGSRTRVQTMADAIDLTGDGGVIKTIVRKSKPDAVAPTEDFPLVDDNAFSSNVNTLEFHQVGEIAKIACKPEYAYDSAGSPPDIPRILISFHP